MTSPDERGANDQTLMSDMCDVWANVTCSDVPSSGPILARSGGREKKSASGHQRYTWRAERERGFLLTSCIFMWCIVMRYPLPQHGEDKKHKVCTKTHITARQRAPHRTHNQRFSGFILFSPPSPSPIAIGLLSCKTGSWEKLLRLIMEISNVG